jgi:hypothetical protein
MSYYGCVRLAACGERGGGSASGATHPNVVVRCFDKQRTLPHLLRDIAVAAQAAGEAALPTRNRIPIIHLMSQTPPRSIVIAPHSVAKFSFPTWPCYRKALPHPAAVLPISVSGSVANAKTLPAETNGPTGVWNSCTTNLRVLTVPVRNGISALSITLAKQVRWKRSSTHESVLCARGAGHLIPGGTGGRSI